MTKTTKPAAAKRTSKAVASKAAKLMHDPAPEVRDVAASALAQAEPEPAPAEEPSELEQLRAENESLRQQLQDQREWATRHGARA